MDDNGTIAPIVLKAAKKAALISDLEREWNAGQKVASLAGPDGDLPGFMKVEQRFASPVVRALPRFGNTVRRVSSAVAAAVVQLRSGLNRRRLYVVQVGPALRRPDGKMVGECAPRTLSHPTKDFTVVLRGREVLSG